MTFWQRFPLQMTLLYNLFEYKVEMNVEMAVSAHIAEYLLHIIDMFDKIYSIKLKFSNNFLNGNKWYIFLIFTLNVYWYLIIQDMQMIVKCQWGEHTHNAFGLRLNICFQAFTVCVHFPSIYVKQHTISKQLVQWNVYIYTFIFPYFIFRWMIFKLPLVTI